MLRACVREPLRERLRERAARMGLYTSGRIAQPMTEAQADLLKFGSSLMLELYPDPTVPAPSNISV